MSSKKKKGRKRIWLWLLLLVVLAGSCLAAAGWWVFYGKNIELGKSKEYIYIRSHSNFDDVEQQLSPKLSSLRTFRWASRWMDYETYVKPGKYLLRDGMGNRELLNMLRLGKQEPVALVVRSYNLPEDLAHLVSKHLEADSTEMMQQMTDSTLLEPYGLSPNQAMAAIIPNTYEFLWNTPADSAFARLYREFEKFWTPERKAKARQHGLSELQCITLASIIARETNKVDEMPTIAGVYLNRLAKNIPLQADPTVKFAMGNFALRRILNAHLEVESPYNTYKNTGLPPGPICNPPATAIDAVLNAANHECIYVCAKEDFSGYHNFAKTLKEHNENAKKFHRALNKRGVR